MKYGGSVPKQCDVLAAHFIADWRRDYDYMPEFIELANRFKTVIPLRHPALIAVSHKKRDPNAGTGFLHKWTQMTQIPAFHFPMETKPFDALEVYLEREVRRNEVTLGSIGEYKEKNSLKQARAFLGRDWWAVEAALDTEIGEWYYGDDIKAEA